MSTALQRMLDRFKKRKKNFKRQVIDMIDGLFDEMVNEYVFLANSEPSIKELENEFEGESGNSSLWAEDDQQQQQQRMDFVVEQSTAQFAKQIKTVIPEIKLFPTATTTSSFAGSSNGQQQTHQQHHQLMDFVAKQSTDQFAKQLKTVIPEIKFIPLTTTTSSAVNFSNGQQQTHQQQQHHQKAKRQLENAASVLTDVHRSTDSYISDDDLMMVPQAKLKVKFNEFKKNDVFLNHDNTKMALQMNFDKMLKPVSHSLLTSNITNKFPQTRTSTSSAEVSNCHRTTHTPRHSDDSNSFDSSHFDVSTRKESSWYVNTVNLKCWVQNCNFYFENKTALDTHISTAHNEIEAFFCFSNTCNRIFKYR